MFKRTKPAVLVAGAGPAGLLGALCLAERGVPIAVVDPRERELALRRRSSSGAVSVLHPASLALLDRHGMAAAVLQRAGRARRIGVYAGAERVSELSFEELSQRAGVPFGAAAMMAQFELEECLRAALLSHRVEVQYETRLARLEQGKGRVLATIDQLEQDSLGYAVAHSELVVERSEELDLEFVLAADGHRSVVRQQLDLAFEEKRAPEKWLVVEARQPALEDARLTIDDDGVSDAAWRIAHDRWHCVFRLHAADASALHAPPELDRSPSSAPRARDERLATWVAARAPWLASERVELVEHGVLDVDYRLADAFGRGRIWLAGAAAHPAPPPSSLNSNVGLCEAERLSAMFAGALGAPLPPDALAAYDRERLQQWQRLFEPTLSASGDGTELAPGNDRGSMSGFDVALGRLTLARAGGSWS